jgi:hypothetical protein
MLGNQEAPKALVHRPLEETREAGRCGGDLPPCSNDSRQPVAGKCSLRALSYYDIAFGSKRGRQTTTASRKGASDELEWS